jgi:hypothetical protein
MKGIKEYSDIVFSMISNSKNNCDKNLKKISGHS